MPPFPTRAISRQTFEQSAVLLQRNAVRIDTIQPAPVLEPDHRFGPFGVPGVPDAAEGPERNLFKDAGDSTQNWFFARLQACG